MNPRQKTFAHEYVVDHNGAKAAIRAGYSERRAKVTASGLLRRPDVAQLVDKLDQERRQKLGVDADWIVAKLVAVAEKSMAGAPKVHQGEIVSYYENGEYKIVMEWSPSGANKALELLAKHLGLLVERTQVEHTGEMVFTLTLDRDLDQEAIDRDEAG